MLEQVESVQIAAEIELVGLEAKRSAIAEIVQHGRERVNLVNQKEDNSKRIQNLEHDIGKIQMEIVTFGLYDGRKVWEECPIENNKVSIQPIKWEPAKGAPLRSEGRRG